MISWTDFLYLLVLVFAVGIIIFIVFSTSQRQLTGLHGEGAVSKELRRRLDGNEYKTLQNLLYPSGKGGSTELTQIDHIVVSIYGIFCLETKAYKGWIYGRANNKYWEQVIFRRKHTFYNPLWQNYAHTEAIKRVLAPGQLKAPVVSLVVFSRAEKIEVAGTASVGAVPEVIDMIRQQLQPIYNASQRDEIYARLQQMNVTARKWRRHHLKSIKARSQQA